MSATSATLAATKQREGSTVTVIAKLPDGSRLLRTISPGKSLIVGSANSCGLSLKAEGINDIHCLLWLDDGELWVQDWYTNLGTFVDGHRISETKLNPGSEVRVGPFRLTVESPHTAHGAGGARCSEAPGQQAGASDGQIASTIAQAAPLSGDTAAHDNTRRSSSGNPQAPPDSLTQPAAAVSDDQIRQELARTQSQLVRLEAELNQLRTRSHKRLREPESCSAETEELLRAEIAQLQQELVERDRRIEELTLVAEPDGPGSGHETDAVPQTDALIDRLEQLLDELAQKDQHQAALQEMLRASEEANRAEREERNQLASWVSDVEDRIAQRESEWQAALDKLERRVEELTVERDRLERALDEVAAGSVASTAQQLTLSQLRAQLADLERKLAESERRRSELERQLASQDVSAVRKEAERWLREQQVELARQRAEVARQRADWERDREVQSRQPDEVNERVRALRQHLVEIHEREVQERKENCLSARVARLWKRLEGRSG